MILDTPGCLLGMDELAVVQVLDGTFLDIVIDSREGNDEEDQYAKASKDEEFFKSQENTLKQMDRLLYVYKYNRHRQGYY
jgi:hypothetical protein